MSTQNSSNKALFLLPRKKETTIITLIPCDYDLSEEDDDVNLTQNSIDSSDLVDDSDDDDAEKITEIFTMNRRLYTFNENSNEITTA